jgi:hypothetical protein
MTMRREKQTHSAFDVINSKVRKLIRQAAEAAALLYAPLSAEQRHQLRVELRRVKVGPADPKQPVPGYLWNLAMEYLRAAVDKLFAEPVRSRLPGAPRGYGSNAVAQLTGGAHTSRAWAGAV